MITICAKEKIPNATEHNELKFDPIWNEIIPCAADQIMRILIATHNLKA